MTGISLSVWKVSNVCFLPSPSACGFLFPGAKQAIAWCWPVIAKNEWSTCDQDCYLATWLFDVSFRLCSCISPWRVTISSSELHWLVSFPSDSFATQFPSQLCQMHCRMDSGMSLTCRLGKRAMRPWNTDWAGWISRLDMAWCERKHRSSGRSFGRHRCP